MAIEYSNVVTLMEAMLLISLLYIPICMIRYIPKDDYTVSYWRYTVHWTNKTAEQITPSMCVFHFSKNVYGFILVIT